MESQGKAGVSQYASAANTKAKDFSLALFNECIPNRRIPNGTYGGVGGRGLITPSYPIVVWPAWAIAWW